MFLSRNKKNNVYSCKPKFCYIKVGFKGVKVERVDRGGRGYGDKGGGEWG